MQVGDFVQYTQRGKTIAAKILKLNGEKAELRLFFPPFSEVSGSPIVQNVPYSFWPTAGTWNDVPEVAKPHSQYCRGCDSKEPHYVTAHEDYCEGCELNLPHPKRHHA